ncbi:MAG: hypothetical protein ACEPOZ_19260 [Marinifilaceae bacterium]|jgi:ligand-binding SRPBCC domain-containing protein
MEVCRLEYEQWIEADIGQVWEFFSDHRNLQQLTPKQLDFRIVYPKVFNGSVYPGMIIEYRIKPFGLWRMNWVTEITQVKEGELFVDEMRAGPYKFWHHQHLFFQHSEGVQMVDILHYILPMGAIGKVLLNSYVQRKIDRIFAYRKEAIKKFFDRKS